jgi:hypothetical protein
MIRRWRKVPNPGAGRPLELHPGHHRSAENRCRLPTFFRRGRGTRTSQPTVRRISRLLSRTRRSASHTSPRTQLGQSQPGAVPLPRLLGRRTRNDVVSGRHPSGRSRGQLSPFRPAGAKAMGRRCRRLRTAASAARSSRGWRSRRSAVRFSSITLPRGWYGL